MCHPTLAQDHLRSCAANDTHTRFPSREATHHTRQYLQGHSYWYPLWWDWQHEQRQDILRAQDRLEQGTAATTHRQDPVWNNLQRPAHHIHHGAKFRADRNSQLSTLNAEKDKLLKSGCTPCQPRELKASAPPPSNIKWCPIHTNGSSPKQFAHRHLTHAHLNYVKGVFSKSIWSGLNRKRIWIELYWI